MRRTQRRPPPAPTPTPTQAPLPEDVPTLQQHLRLARTMNAHLHRQLAQAIGQASMAPQESTSEEVLHLEVQALRERLAVLTLHYEDAQREIERLKHFWAMACRTLGWRNEDPEVLFPQDQALDQLCKTLIALAHPDKWSQGQPASELAHELLLVLNAQREQLAQ